MTERSTDAVFSHPDVHRPATQAEPPAGGERLPDPVFQEPDHAPAGDDSSRRGARTSE
ncbi:hypothetical protein [Actinosynnema sp. NPDC023587]|uniref:hypothetical protein n=1 Tax=Actinosynnema sp. NPDC023587 TaxID=3154695 RepID=UPI0033C84CEC